MTKQQTLIDWAHLSLHQRVMYIEEQFGVKIHHSTLVNLYKKHKISYIKPQYAYCRKMEQKKEIGE